MMIGSLYQIYQMIELDRMHVMMTIDDANFISCMAKKKSVQTIIYGTIQDHIDDGFYDVQCSFPYCNNIIFFFFPGYKADMSIV